jgi:hypothetical protein
MNEGAKGYVSRPFLLGKITETSAGQNKKEKEATTIACNWMIETLVNEEALLFAMHLRHEKQCWIPRIASLTY